MKIKTTLLIALLGYTGLLFSQQLDVIEGSPGDLTNADSIAVEIQSGSLLINNYQTEKSFLKNLAAQPKIYKQWLMVRDSLALRSFLAGFNNTIPHDKKPQFVKAPAATKWLLVVSKVYMKVPLNEEDGLPLLRLEYILVDAKTQRNQYGRFSHKKLVATAGTNLAEQLQDAFYRAGSSLATAALNPPAEE
ncbi:MAG: hypothetical protein U5L96_20945 [Owenweeksia sp.]|nr:hypothetical protein [Owenweeksia sp.]